MPPVTAAIICYLVIMPFLDTFQYKILHDLINIIFAVKDHHTNIKVYSIKSINLSNRHFYLNTKDTFLTTEIFKHN